jgi:hypothetical protein
MSSYYDRKPTNTATASASVGFPVFAFATMVLLVLKIAALNGASWGLNISWFWVFSPLIIGFALTLFILAIFFLVILVIAIFSK